jgi:hypothetical protein
LLPRVDKPREPPAAGPTEFEFIINLKAARTLELTALPGCP